MTGNARTGPDCIPKPPGRLRGHAGLPGLFAARKIAAPKEIIIHMGVAKLLRDHCRPAWRWTHIPSGERRDVRTASKLKQMGVQRGWPDFLLISPRGYVHCLELKRPGGRLTEDQKEFSIWCETNFISYVIARSLDEVLEAFDDWQCIRVVVGGSK